jgi:hypothetical protein
MGPLLLVTPRDLFLSSTLLGSLPATPSTRKLKANRSYVFT